MQQNQCDEILEVASLAGKIMLESGGEISRVEQTVVHLCQAFGVNECEVFATPTAIVMSLVDDKGAAHSMVRRITQRATRLDKVEEINSLSRSAAARGASLAQIKVRLREIQNLSVYSPLVLTLVSGLGAATFAVFFGGGWLEFLCAFVSGCLVKLMMHALANLQPNLFVAHFAGGLAAALCGFVCYLLGFTQGWETVTIAALMLMVPGVAITNALRDIAAGELLAGISRAVEAFCIAAALACGTALVFGLVQLAGGIAV